MPDTNKEPRMNHQQEEHNIAIESRVGRLEGAVDTLAGSVKTIGNDVSTLSAGFNDFKQIIIEKIGKVSTPKWPLIISVATLVVTIILMGATLTAFLFSGQESAIRHNENTIVTIQDNLMNQEFSRGQNEVWKENIVERINSLDTKAKKEM